jgi:hypothetical protein
MMVKFKVPKSIGACADLLYKLKEQKAEVNKKLSELAEQESAVKEYIINNLPKDSTGVAGRVARVSINVKAVPQVADWDKFYAFVKKKNAFELMQRRLSEAAIKEVWDNGKSVPGVEAFMAVTVSLKKV